MDRPAHLKLLLVLLLGIPCATRAQPVHLHVARDGSDRNPGTLSAPLATLAAARDAARALPSSAREAGITIWIGSGAYSLTATFDLDERDSGTERGPVIYRAIQGADVRLVGGIRFGPDALAPVTDPSILARAIPSARAGLVSCDLEQLHERATGRTAPPMDVLLPRDEAYSLRAAVPELFFDDEALPFSRWPNEGWATYDQIIDAGSVPRFGDTSNRPGTLTYTGNRPDRWREAERILLHGYFAWDWYDDVLEVCELDTAAKRITFTTPHLYGLKPGKRFRALGLLEEIDEPGEWMIDHTSGTLYLLPPEHLDGGSFALSLLKTPLIRLTGTRFVSFRDLTLEVTQGMGVEIVGGTDNQIADCTIRNVGTCGVLVRPRGFEAKDAGALHQFPAASGDPLVDGRRNRIVGCHLHDIGTTGISMIGGDRATLTAAGHAAINNDIHRFARRQRANQPAINMNGVGHLAANNHIHDAPHVALNYSGNDHLISRNELHHVCQETSDVGVIYSGRDWTYRGNVVRHNHIHHVGNNGSHGSNAVYLDDSHSSTRIVGNVLHEVHRAAMIGGGRDNVFENNLIVDCELALHIDNRSEGWAHRYQKRGGDHRMYAKLEAVRHDQAPHATRYPALARMLDESPHKPLGNVVRNNVVVRSPWIHGPKHFLQIGSNLLTDEDPGFRDIESGDLRLMDLASIQAELPYFQPIPFDSIGLLPGPHRAWRNP